MRTPLLLLWLLCRIQEFAVNSLVEWGGCLLEKMTRHLPVILPTWATACFGLMHCCLYELILSLFFYCLRAVPSFQSVPSAAEVRPPLAGGSRNSSIDELPRIKDPQLWNHSLRWSIFTTWQRSTLCKITTCQRIFVCISFCCTISQYSHTKWAWLWTDNSGNWKTFLA